MTGCIIRVQLYFRQGQALAAMQADVWGMGLLSLAQKVEGRLVE
jgi:hypothetical protein